jgi:hypothetical protein
VILGNIFYEHVLRWPENLFKQYPDLDKTKFAHMAKVDEK